MKATLHLQDGTKIQADYAGPSSVTNGEVVFNTGMVGYPETMTDPSYRGQILVFTYPMIGNYGIPKKRIQEGVFFESNAIHVRGIIVQELIDMKAHYEAELTLGEWCAAHEIPILHNVDTRALTHIIRDEGVMLGQIVPEGKKVSTVFADPNDGDLVGEVTVKEVQHYKGKRKMPTVVLVDCGIKYTILTELMNRGFSVYRVPYDYDYMNSDLKFDGVFLSNGPGDPKQCEKTIEVLRDAMTTDMPIFGICLGTQIMALSAGADTYKLSFGHRGQNQPCIDELTGRTIVTSQNHGFAVNPWTLPKGFKIWFRNLNDDTVEGIYHEGKPFKAVQFHPEATPGPVDANYLFDEFLTMFS